MSCTYTCLRKHTCTHDSKRKADTKQQQQAHARSSSGKLKLKPGGAAGGEGLTSAVSHASFPTAVELGIDVSAYGGAAAAVPQLHAVESPVAQAAASMGNTGVHII